MKKESTMQDMIEGILRLVDFNQSNRKNNDEFRTNHCAARANGQANILGFLGVEYDFGTYMDEDYEMVGYFYVDGVTLVKNGKIDWKAYSDAVLDKEHSWGSRVLTIQNREEN